MDSIEKFLSKVKVNADGCFEWQGYITPNGYGMFHRQFQRIVTTVYAHREAYQLFRGPIPDEMNVWPQVRQSQMLQSGAFVYRNAKGQHA